MRLAAAALERLDREVNGGGSLRRPAEAVEMRPLLEAAARRWRARASLGGGSLSLRWRAGARGRRSAIGSSSPRLSTT